MFVSEGLNLLLARKTHANRVALSASNSYKKLKDVFTHQKDDILTHQSICSFVKASGCVFVQEYYFQLSVI